MLENSTVHNRICQIYKFFYSHYMTGKKDDIIYLLLVGMVRMHISSYIQDTRLVSAKEVGEYIKVIYAYVVDIESILG
jgi:hypothetical protein